MCIRDRFDPEARRACWDVLSDLAADGTTVFLTTHYMDEARALAGRVAVLRDGAVVAMGRPHELVAGAGTAEIHFELDAVHDVVLAEVVRAPLLRRGRRVTLATAAPTATLHALTGWALERGVELGRLEVLRPSLEDVYLSLTGGTEGLLDNPPGAPTTDDRAEGRAAPASWHAERAGVE